MSNHSNQHTPNGKRTIVGHNPTYLARKQKASRDSSTKPAGSNDRQEDASVGGAHRTTSPTSQSTRPAGFGDGHYKPNK